MTRIDSTWKRASDLWGYRHEPEHLHALVEVYWRVLLSFAAILTIGAVSFGVIKLFSALGEGGSEPTLLSSGGAIASLNRAELQGVLTGLAERRERYDFLKANPPSIADPSR